MSVLSILQFLFSHKDSLEKWWCQGSWTTIARRHFLHFRTIILFKSRHDRGSRRSLLWCIFCILAQGFSAKVATEVPFKASCAFICLKKSVIISKGFTLIFEDESCWHEDDLFELHKNQTISSGFTHIFRLGSCCSGLSAFITPLARVYKLS